MKYRKWLVFVIKCSCDINWRTCFLEYVVFFILPVGLTRLVPFTFSWDSGPDWTKGCLSTFYLLQISIEISWIPFIHRNGLYNVAYFEVYFFWIYIRLNNQVQIGFLLISIYCFIFPLRHAFVCLDKIIQKAECTKFAKMMYRFIGKDVFNTPHTSTPKIYLIYKM